MTVQRWRVGFDTWHNPVLLACCGLTLVTGGIAYLTRVYEWASISWAAGSFLMGAVLMMEIIQRLARKEAGVDLIALLSIGAALVLEQMLVAAVVALMLATGRTLESFSKQYAERELRALIERAP